MSDEQTVVATTANGFDPTELARSFGGEAARIDDENWRLTLPSALHGLALTRLTSPEDLVQVTDHRHTVDADGWQDWTESGAGEYEVPQRSLPSVPTPGQGPVFRYDDAWVWDPNAPAAAATELARLGLTSLTEEARDLSTDVIAAGKGAHVWKAVKIGWKLAGHVGTAITIYQLSSAGWKALRKELVEQRARMEERELHLRITLELTQTRRERLETGSEASRRKARQYYNTLDALIAANSR
ncbi:hypothetical protein ACLM5J_19335 [Nocardioides sp. Bht2]|uniref:hypothetical protein n=1 Tax=Nocardioides sp. Bht2 TaxID=3392297 RepID=UPI0039B37055